MLSIEEIYSNRNRGPWHPPLWLHQITGQRENLIMSSITCEQYPHKFNKDTDFYLNDNCITMYCPVEGQFTYDTVKKTIVG